MGYNLVLYKKYTTISENPFKSSPFEAFHWNNSSSINLSYYFWRVLIGITQMCIFHILEHSMNIHGGANDSISGFIMIMMIIFESLLKRDDKAREKRPNLKMHLCWLFSISSGISDGYRVLLPKNGLVYFKKINWTKFFLHFSVNIW